ncbi:MAG: response regulator [Proteobacteria bacterium]|nr:response regulator [Pseudomonadota bacterium]
MNKILVADDSAMTQELFHDLFVGKGYEVFQAYNGSEAISLFDAVHPDLVLLDIMMPSVSGMEVLRHIKSTSAAALVVMMTAHGSEETAVDAMKSGADDYLIKPLSYRKVLALIEELLEKSRVRRENLELRERIHKTESYLAHLVDNISEAIISTDSQGGILSFNLAAQKLWSASEKDMLACTFFELFKGGAKNGYVEKIIALTSDEGSYQGEFVFSRSDGSTFHGFLSTSAFKMSDGEPDGIVAMIRDMTIEKRLTEQLVESARLAALGKIVDAVAHEVRNPLVSMSGFIRRLQKRSAAGSEEGKYFDAINTDIARLERMVGEIEEYVDFAKTHKSCFGCINITTVIRELAGLFDFSKANVRFDVAATTLPEIFADRAYLDELFRNLFENALEAMPEGGDLSVSFALDEDYLNVFVRDSGCGIPQDKQGDIYDPFFTSKMSGAGIGLAKVYLIVEEHHGLIDVQSEEGRGTTFKVSFPLERRQPVRL